MVRGCPCKCACYCTTLLLKLDVRIHTVLRVTEGIKHAGDLLEEGSSEYN